MPPTPALFFFLSILCFQFAGAAERLDPSEGAEAFPACGKDLFIYIYIYMGGGGNVHLKEIEILLAECVAVPKNSCSIAILLAQKNSCFSEQGCTPSLSVCSWMCRWYSVIWNTIALRQLLCQLQQFQILSQI